MKLVEYSIRLYTIGDEEEIVSLLEHVFNGWPHLDLPGTNLDHWNWKYKGNPTDILTVAVATQNQRIIGCFHTIPMRWKIFNKILLCQTGADLAVHPEHRGIGVSTKLRDLLREQYPILGIKHTHIITGNPILVKSYKKHQPSFPVSVINLVRIRDIDMQLKVMPTKNSIILRLGYHTSKRINDMRNINKKKYLNSSFDVYEERSFNENFLDLWIKVSGGYDFIVERKPEYLNWRYSDPRVGEFKIKVVKEEDNLLGYSVLRINRFLETYPVGYIVDLLAPQERMDAAEALAVDAVRFFDDEGVNLVNYLIPRGHPYQKLLGSLGFLDSRVKIHMFYNTYGNVDEIAPLQNTPAERAFFSWGDLDMLPVSLPE